MARWIVFDIIGALIAEYPDMLFSSKQEFNGVILYSGNSIGKPTETFISQCREALLFLTQKDARRYRLFVKHVGRIMGTVSFTHFWDFPRVLGVNYTQVSKNNALSLAGIFVSETVFARFFRRLNINSSNYPRFMDICLKEEIRFLERATGEKMSSLEIQKLMSTKCWTAEKQRAFMLKGLNELSPNNWFAKWFDKK